MGPWNLSLVSSGIHQGRARTLPGCPSLMLPTCHLSKAPFLAILNTGVEHLRLLRGEKYLFEWLSRKSWRSTILVQSHSPNPRHMGERNARMQEKQREVADPITWVQPCLPSSPLECGLLSCRLTPYEWYSPHPCAQGRCNLLVNQYSLGNSLWFPVGGFMQQGSTIAPRALSTRCVSGVW